MRLILLTEQAFFESLGRPLRAASPKLEIVLARTLAELEAAATSTPLRILSVGAEVIVPARILAQLATPAYNIHPGPPNYPGIFPSVFALYDGAPTFAVTLHEMAEAVDSGPIVNVDEFTIEPSWNRLALDTKTFAVLLGMVSRLAPQLADVTTPLPHSARVWSGTKRTRKDFDALCRLSEDATPEEFARRYRAIGEGPDHTLSITRFGRTFRLQSETRGTVVRGGQPA